LSIKNSLSWSPPANPSTLSSEFGTHKTVRTRFWPWLSSQLLRNLLSCSLLARERQVFLESQPKQALPELVCTSLYHHAALEETRNVLKIQVQNLDFSSGTNLEATEVFLARSTAPETSHDQACPGAREFSFIFPEGDRNGWQMRNRLSFVNIQMRCFHPKP